MLITKQDYEAYLQRQFGDNCNIEVDPLRHEIILHVPRKPTYEEIAYIKNNSMPMLIISWNVQNHTHVNPTTSTYLDPDEVPEGFEICSTCEGGGMTMECYGGMPSEVKCETCFGEGIVEREDEERNTNSSNCNHEWEAYIGLAESFDHCKHCGTKRE